MEDVLIADRKVSGVNDFKGCFKWINPEGPIPNTDRGYFYAKWKMKGPRNQGGGAKKRRGRKWKGLGKRELKTEWGVTYFHRSLMFKGWKAVRIRNRVRETLSDLSSPA